MEGLKFTQEVKDNWLTALKSGKYKQGFVYLKHPMDGTHCCIGVLADITLGLSTNEGGSFECSPYDFLNRALGKEVVDNLWKTNDLDHRDNKNPDYSNVIPLIEALEVEK